METVFDQKEFVVIDNGTGFIKAGFSGEDLPRCVIPTVVGMKEIELDAAMNAGNEHAEVKFDYSYGMDAFAKRGDHDLHFPIDRGIITDMDRMENLWHHIFENELSLDPKNMNILLTDSPLNKKENKTIMADILFNKFQVESLTIMNTSVLSLFSTGKTSGLVVECGEGTSYSVPIFEGYALPHAIHQLDVAG
jgi:actin-related protein